MCSFCTGKRTESCLVDAGNNAETRVVLDFCDGCWAEMEKDPVAFDKKHREQIERIATRQTVMEARP